MNGKLIVSALAVASASAVQAGFMDEPNGIKVGDRLTLTPYVSLSYTYDSNIDSSHHSKSGSSWNISPGINAAYKADNVKIDGGVFYTYHAYNRYTSQLNSSSYGEHLALTWQNSLTSEPGWTVKLNERYSQISQDDDMSNHNGRGIGRDSQQLTFGGVLERRLNERVHAAVDADYYLLDYDNDVDKYAALYGWKRATAGGEIGYAASQWLDIVFAANYMWYWQDNNRNRDSDWRDTDGRGKHISGNSKGWSVMGGVATRATEKLTYRILTGWSRFEYGGGIKSVDGWTYQASADWQLDAENTMHLMAMGASYYQPSEREYGSAIKVYNFCVGFAKSIVRNKLSATLDLAYRKETHEVVEYSADDIDEDIWTARFGLNYRINRIASVYGNFEYQTEMSRGGAAHNNAYDYDRWRGTVGLRLTY